MGEKGVTLLEVHLHGDTQFGPSSVGRGTPEIEPAEMADGESTEVEVEAADEASEEGLGPDVEVGVEALVAILVLLAIALGARRLLGDGEEWTPPGETGVEVTVTEE